MVSLQKYTIALTIMVLFAFLFLFYFDLNALDHYNYQVTFYLGNIHILLSLMVLNDRKEVVKKFFNIKEFLIYLFVPVIIIAVDLKLGMLILNAFTINHFFSQMLRMSVKKIDIDIPLLFWKPMSFLSIALGVIYLNNIHGVDYSSLIIFHILSFFESYHIISGLFLSNVLYLILLVNKKIKKDLDNSFFLASMVQATLIVSLFFSGFATLGYMIGRLFHDFVAIYYYSFYRKDKYWLLKLVSVTLLILALFYMNDTWVYFLFHIATLVHFFIDRYMWRGHSF